MLEDLKTIILKMKTSMHVHEVNQQILQLKRKSGKADDIWILHDEFWDDNHQVYFITTNKKFNIKSINLDYQSTRDLGFQWTYVCNKCGEILLLLNDKERRYHCKCHEYVLSM